MSLYLVGSKSFWVILVVIFLRYLVLASVAFLVFYVIKKKAWQFRKIQFPFPTQNDYWREVLYSVITAVIFASVGYIVFISPLSRYNQVYHFISDYGLVYFVISIVFTILLHDTYFYWIHWLMHRPSVYRWVHRTHHLSTNPSPWAAMAFHPVESFLEAGIIALIAFLYPLHPLAIGIFLLFMMMYNVYGHLGYELYPRGFSTSRLGKWINTSVNHNLHHQYVTGNYGLYFLFWDRWMGTLRKDYDQHFEEVKSRVRE